MNIIKFIEQFTNEGIIKNLDGKTSRRESFSQFGKIGAGAALAAVPFSTLFTQKANARTTAAFSSVDNTPTEALQLALTLEYLEDEFYQKALDTNGLIPASDQTVIALISQHENAHVEFLKSALGEANTPAKPTFDFTVGGTFDTFDNYETFLALAQAFEDTGVRAYKGQAGNLMSESGLLKAALQIHSVEARHASEIRRMRGLKGWITENNRGTGMPAATQDVYNGEENTIQAGYNAATEFGSAAGTQAFDEILTGDQATSIASIFIV
ncbi:ferritin-like domain-containing protein [Flavobacterium rhizosphaerae]|uniref:Ferritin-like domain-containing protein n=1 Tax=Flavobacterium rhizosphaerae TaxID=3163298 RepID=A0ABW8YYX4_9FLAO